MQGSDKRPSSSPECVPIDLREHFTLAVTAGPDNRGAGAMDGQFGLPAEEMPGPGKVKLCGAGFDFPPYGAGVPDCFVPDNQVVAVPSGKYSSLLVLGTAVFGSTGSELTFNFAGGMKWSDIVRFTDWGHGAQFGDQAAVSLSCRTNPAGTAPLASTLWLQVIHLPPVRRLESISFGWSPNLRLFAASLTRELFEMPPEATLRYLLQRLAKFSEYAEPTVVLHDTLEDIRALRDDAKLEADLDSIRDDILAEVGVDDLFDRDDNDVARLDGVFNRILPRLEAAIKQAAARLAASSNPSPLKITLLGHSHLDAVWLWPWNVTFGKAYRTFSRNIERLERFPGMTFAQSCPLFYWWMEERNPELFAGIRDQVAAGRWEPVGGMWVESDGYMPCGEAQVRQRLYGQRYFIEKFGRASEVAWIPDTFGMHANHPQIIRKTGGKYFFTTKLLWNDANVFPYHHFIWESPDGSQVLALQSPIGCGAGPGPHEGLEKSVRESNVLLKPGREVRVNAAAPHVPEDAKSDEYIPEILAIYGEGDGGEGPSDSMCYRADTLCMLPEYGHGSAHGHFETIAKKYAGRLPIWNDELYLETHRGTTTAQARIKELNRKAEALLLAAEKWDTLAGCLAYAGVPDAPRGSFLKKGSLQDNELQRQDDPRGSSADAVFGSQSAPRGASMQNDIYNSGSNPHGSSGGGGQSHHNNPHGASADAASGPVGDPRGSFFEKGSLQNKDLRRPNDPRGSSGYGGPDYQNDPRGAFATADLNRAWRKLLFNQFHDILPGTSIPQAYVDTELDFDDILETAGRVRHDALREIARRIDTASAAGSGQDAIPLQLPDKAPLQDMADQGGARFAGRALLLFNPLSWERAETVSIPWGYAGVNVIDDEGNAVPCQVVFRDGGNHLVFQAAVPGFGYAQYRLLAGRPRPQPKIPITVTGRTIENRFFRLTLAEDGTIAEVHDKASGKNILSGPANKVLFFRNRPDDWSNWNIDPDYEKHPVTAEGPVTIEVIDRGPVTAAFRITSPAPGPGGDNKKKSRGAGGGGTHAQSGDKAPTARIVQEIRCYADDGRIDFTTDVDLLYRESLVKVAFPFDVGADFVTTETGYGTHSRPTRPQSDFEKAKWEVWTQKWLDLRGPATGVTLVNDSRYGFDVSGDRIRLTLVKGGIMPDPDTDVGTHRVRYGLHVGAPAPWKRGYEFNFPVTPLLEEDHPGALPPSGSLASISAPNVCWEVLKPAEPDFPGAGAAGTAGDATAQPAADAASPDTAPPALVIRVFEVEGRDTENVTIDLPFAAASAEEIDFLELEVLGPVQCEGRRLTFAIGHDEIKAIRVFPEAGEAGETS